MSKETTASYAARQVKAMACRLYKLGIYDRQSKNMDNRDHLEPEAVAGMIGYLKFRNATGSDIYITQATDIDRALILVDDLDESKIRLMEEFGAGPACVVETSPANLQAWISLGESPMPRAQRKIVASFLASRFGGDPASADANHFGRLCGFTNQKPKHLWRGLHPFAILRSDSGRSAEKSDFLRKMAAEAELKSIQAAREKENALRAKMPHKYPIGTCDPDVFFIRRHAAWLSRRRFSGRPVDLSVGDYAVASEMIMAGYARLDIFNAMASNSPDIDERKKNHVQDYIDRTISAAMNRVFDAADAFSNRLIGPEDKGEPAS